MKTVEDKSNQYTAPLPAVGTNSFFVAVMYTGNQQQLVSTIQSVIKQKTESLHPEIYIFHPATVPPQTTASDEITRVPFEQKEDFFSKFTLAVERSKAQYCVTLLSGEEFFEGAFDSAEKIFSKHKQVNWLTGIQALRTKGGFNVTLGTTAMRRWSYQIYERNLYKNSGRYIPPASTFWRKDIWPSISPAIHFVELNTFCEDLWLAFFKTEKLYTCKAYFSSSDSYDALNMNGLKLPNSYTLIEDSVWKKVKEFLFMNNIPYLRLFYRNESDLAPVIRFDHSTQSYYLSEY